MRSPLAEQTILQGRYRLLRCMAEGGFARTYLAEDQGRFHEKCVVKEFCLNANDVTVFEKSQELFQREAKTLYKLDHPQIPNFRALFTETFGSEKRVFLVQDYVEGQTYRALLQARLKAGQLFSELEIRQLLRQLLPVLSYIHGQNIIHRDLSPENLILRTVDQRPVLIDFGVVKTVVTQLQQANIVPMGTAVGKFGFAPVEQLQSGRAYPSSDLYSLAVCCLVLLTGKEPPQLLDDKTAAWNWQPYVSLTPALTAILERMLAHKPSDRYTSADDVLLALQSLPSIPQPNTPLAPPSVAIGAPAMASPSEGRTLAVSPKGTSVVDSPYRKSPNRATPPPKQSPAKQPRPIPSPAPQSPKLGALLFTGLMTTLFTAGIAWLVMAYLTQRPWDRRSPTVVPTPSPLASQTPKPTPTIRYSQTLDLGPGQSVAVQDSLQPMEVQVYRFNGPKGVELSAQIKGDNVTFSLLRSNLSAVNGKTQGVTTWQGLLPQTDTYTVRVQNNSTQTAQPFDLNLALSQPAPPEISPTPSQTPLASPTPASPTLDEVVLNFGPNIPIQQLDGQLEPAHVQRYYVSAQAGQVLSAAVVEDQGVTLTLRNAQGQVLEGGQSVLNWEAILPEAGTYQIDVVPVDETRSTRFAIEVALK